MKHSIPHRLALAAALGTGLAALPSAQGGAFLDLGTGYANSVSDDGLVIVGGGFSGAFRWEFGLGKTSLGEVEADAVSADGTIVFGDLNLFPGEAGIWTTTSPWSPIGGLVGANGCLSTSSAYDMSKDGSVAVGLGSVGCDGKAFKWTAAGGVEDLGVLGPNSARANAVSGDGNTVGGWDEAANGTRRAAIWFPDGTEELILESALNPDGGGEVWGFNHDGSIAVGSGCCGTPNAWSWTEAGGVVDLGALPGASPGDIGTAYAVTNDGSMIVGTSGSFFTGDTAFIWTKEEGMMVLNDFLAAQGIVVKSTLTFARDITPDGKFIVGSKGASPFNTQAWTVKLPLGIEYRVGASAANILELSGGGSTNLGGTFVATVANATGPMSYAVVSGGSDDFPLLGGRFLVDLTNIYLLQAATPVSGVATHNIAIPAAATFLVGTGVYMQAVSLDASQPQGWALSNGLKFVVCQ